MTTVLSTPAEVDAAWLTALFRGQGLLRSARITGIRHEQIGVGMLGDSVRFFLDYDRDEGAPATIVGKFASVDPTSRATGVGLGLYVKEVEFYRQIAATVAVRAPHCYFADIDAATGLFTLLLEDMGPARAGNQLTGCSLEDARQAMIQAAALHGPRWNDPALKAMPFLDNGNMERIVMHGMPACRQEFHRRYDDALEPQYMEVCDRYGREVGRFYARAIRPWTVVHHDFRLDNMMFDARGGTVPLVLLDWQCVTANSGALDVAYFLGAGIAPELRRRHERELLGLYLEELKRHGVADYSWDELWHDYRVTALAGVSMAIFASVSTMRTERGDAMFLAMARGACAQAIDVDSYGALDCC